MKELDEMDLVRYPYELNIGANHKTSIDEILLMLKNSNTNINLQTLEELRLIKLLEILTTHLFNQGNTFHNHNLMQRILAFRKYYNFSIPEFD